MKAKKPKMAKPKGGKIKMSAGPFNAAKKGAAKISKMGGKKAGKMPHPPKEKKPKK